MLSFKPVFTLLFHQEALQFLFTFSHKGGVICVSEVIDISSSNLDSSFNPGLRFSYTKFWLLARLSSF